VVYECDFERPLFYVIKDELKELLDAAHADDGSALRTLQDPWLLTAVLEEKMKPVYSSVINPAGFHARLSIHTSMTNINRELRLVVHELKETNPLAAMFYGGVKERVYTIGSLTEESIWCEPRIADLIDGSPMATDKKISELPKLFTMEYLFAIKDLLIGIDKLGDYLRQMTPEDQQKFGTCFTSIFGNAFTGVYGVPQVTIQNLVDPVWVANYIAALQRARV
jgi:hypothetical protein